MARFFTPEFFADPYQVYDELRAEPVCWDEELGGWVLTGYYEVAAALADPRVTRGGGPREGDLLTRLLTRMMLFMDPPGHTRLRALASRAFTPGRVEALRPRIAAIVDDLLADAGEGQWDLIAGLAYPLPVIVIAEILSLPPGDRAMFKRWSDDVIAVAAGRAASAEARERALRSAAGLAEYFARLVAELRAHPNHTLLSGLAEASEGSSRLSGDELLANVILLLMNGHETTTFAIGNGVRALLAHPGELTRLRQDPRLSGSAVEEILRYDGPIQMRGVSAREDLELEPARIRAGQVIWLAIGATGRDRRVFRDPNRFDIGRSPNRHLQFGRGAHFCLGAALARAEIEVALSGLLRRFGRIDPAAGQVEWHEIDVFRGPGRCRSHSAIKGGAVRRPPGAHEPVRLLIRHDTNPTLSQPTISLAAQASRAARPAPRRRRPAPARRIPQRPRPARAAAGTGRAARTRPRSHPAGCRTADTQTWIGARGHRHDPGPRITARNRAFCARPYSHPARLSCAESSVRVVPLTRCRSLSVIIGTWRSRTRSVTFGTQCKATVWLSGRHLAGRSERCRRAQVAAPGTAAARGAGRRPWPPAEARSSPTATSRWSRRATCSAC